MSIPATVVLAFLASGRTMADSLLLVPVQVLEAQRHEAVLQTLIESAEAEWRAWPNDGSGSVEVAESVDSILSPLDDQFERRVLSDETDWVFDSSDALLLGSGVTSPVSKLKVDRETPQSSMSRSHNLLETVFEIVDDEPMAPVALMNETSMEENAALQSLVKSAASLFDSGDDALSMRHVSSTAVGTPTSGRVRTYRPVQNQYFLDWPWVQGEGRNMFFLLFGPPALVLGIVMGVYIVTRAARHG